MLLIIAASSYGSQYTRASAMMLAKPSYVAPFGYFGLIAAVCIDIFIFKSTFNIFTIIGIFLTSIGLLANLFIDIKIILKTILKVIDKSGIDDDLGVGQDKFTGNEK